MCCDGAMSEMSSLRDVVSVLQQRLADCLARTNELHEGELRKGRLAAEQKVRYKVDKKERPITLLLGWKGQWSFSSRRKDGVSLSLRFEESPQREATSWVRPGVKVSRTRAPIRSRRGGGMYWPPW